MRTFSDYRVWLYFLGGNMIKDLLKLNVNDHTKKKGKLTYLSWAWAWAQALEVDPTATFEVQMFGDKCFMDINGTAMVWVTVTMFGKPMTCQLPVMNHLNKAIQNPDAFAVNTSIMRCMTKALSLHGLGLYIYAGEDLPPSEEPESTVNESEMMDWLTAIADSENLETLQKNFVQAISAADGDKEWKLKIIKVKDTMKKKLEAK